jgi:hypothetical protein
MRTDQVREVSDLGLDGHQVETIILRHIDVLDARDERLNEWRGCIRPSAANSGLATHVLSV